MRARDQCCIREDGFVFRLVSETVRPADHIDNNVTTE